MKIRRLRLLLWHEGLSAPQKVSLMQLLEKHPSDFAWSDALTHIGSKSQTSRYLQAGIVHGIIARVGTRFVWVLE